ncbi:MAG: hypothetical protein JWO44_633 [Bacteroidetes bacterium]|nr:hypothetical protein [Bacteroidota bacterium]
MQLRILTCMFSFCFLLFTNSLPAQNKELDSLLKAMTALENGKRDITADTNLIETYNSISAEYYMLGDRSKEQAYSKKMMDLAILMLRRPDISAGLKTYLLHKEAAGYGDIGTYYSDVGDYPQSLEYYFKALKIDESIGNKVGILRHYGNISNTYSNLGESPKAIDYAFKTLAIAKLLHSADDEATVYITLGSTYNAMDNNYLALKYYAMALQIFGELKDTVSVAMTLGNTGDVYRILGDSKLHTAPDVRSIPEYAISAAYYKKALALFEYTSDIRSKSIHLSNLGLLYINMKRFGEAEKLLRQALQLAKDIDYPDGIQETDKNLSILYSASGDTEQAFEYYKNYIAARDSLFNEENTKQNVKAEMNYEFEKKEAAQKAEHEKEVIALEAENRIQKNSRNFIMLLGVMLLLLVASGFVYFNNRKALQLRQMYSQQLLLSQEKERQRVSKELHDSIGQNILFIKNQMIKNNDLRLMPAVDEALEEVRSISKDLYPNQLEKYGLVAAVDALAEKIKESSDIFVSYDLDVVDKELPPDKQINYYRIIQECVTNALKHADASALRISASKSNGMLELVVQDNGKGFDKGILSEKAQRSFGLLNLEERVKYLKGKLVVETSPGKGTKYIFSIPS